MNTKHSLTATCYDKHGRQLSVAQNSYVKSHPIQAYFANKVGLDEKVFLHAEIHALLKAKDKKIHTLHVVRKTKSGCLRNAKPCAICQEAIKAYGVEKVFYSDANGCIVEMNIKEN